MTTDPADNIFVECADAARADYLVAGNERHFPKFWKNTKIIGSREFLKIIAPHLIDSACRNVPKAKNKTVKLGSAATTPQCQTVAAALTFASSRWSSRSRSAI